MKIQEVTNTDLARKDCVFFYHQPVKAEYYYYPDSIRRYYEGLYQAKIKVVKLPYLSDNQRQVMISNINIDYPHRQFKVINSLVGIEDTNNPKSEKEIGEVIHPKTENVWKSATSGPIDKLLSLIKSTS